MVKTQVQFPDHLYRDAKRIAKEYEMSFAEVVRRGLEEAIRSYPPGRLNSDEWILPSAKHMGAPRLSERDWDMASRDIP